MLGRAGIYYALSTPQMERAAKLHLLGNVPLLRPPLSTLKIAVCIQISMHVNQALCMVLFAVVQLFSSKSSQGASHRNLLPEENQYRAGQALVSKEQLS